MLKEKEEYWLELFWIVSDEKPSEYESLKRIEVFEFFTLLEIKDKRQKEKINELNNKNKNVGKS